ncbi:hypothetical protein [Sediminicola arcticus]|uniref:Membrane metalloprotease n=1 Tax=Sediminicola arcticus TaxID=1574308 RepID=A0ABV2SRV6_9FLAO
MKLKYVYLAVAAVAIIISCSKDSSGGSASEESVVINKTPNLQGTGDSANDLLSNDSYTKLLIEIAYVTGFRPAQQTISDVEEYLKEVTFKQDIEVILKELPSPNEETLTLKEIDDLEKKNRTAYNDGNTIAVYIYFADAPADSDDPDSNLATLGAVYRNTSMVIYERTVRKLANSSILITVATAETATMHHEFGHLFGLVNLGGNMVNPHESQSENSAGVIEGDSHCDIDGCLMEAALEFGRGMKKMLTAKNGAVPELDAECRRDLQANGGR